MRHSDTFLHAPSRAAGYLAAAALVSVALAVSLALAPWLAPNFYMVFVSAVFVAAWYGGAGPGTLAAGLGVLVLHLFLIALPGTAPLRDAGVLARAAGFLALSAGGIALAAQARAMHLRALAAARESAQLASELQEQAVELEQQTEEAQSLTEELEQQVEEAARLRTRLEEANRRLEGTLETERAAAAALREREDERRGEEAWLRFIAHAGEVLSSSLDYEETLRRVCRLAVPALADYCVVDLVEDGVLRRVEAVHADPAFAGTMERLRRRPLPLSHPTHPAVLAVRSGEARATDHAADAFADLYTAPEHAALIRELAPRACVAVPIRAGSEVMGAVTFVASTSGRRYGPAEVRRTEELGIRAGYAIQNARLFARAVEANRAKSDFLAVMSHELRTPLNAILGYTDLFLAGVPEPMPERVLPQVERVRDAARHLRDLIEEVLSFARLEAGQEAVALEEAELGEIARSAAALVEPLARERGLAFRLSLPPDPVVLRTDARKVRQIVVNLAANAVKFTEAGEVALHAAADGAHAVVRVRDTGDGIEADHLERIFEPFWQADQRLARAHGGSGLGLSVARHLARLLGGEIVVESRPGEGSEFALRLPLAAGGNGNPREEGR